MFQSIFQYCDQLCHTGYILSITIYGITQHGFEGIHISIEASLLINIIEVSEILVRIGASFC